MDKIKLIDEIEQIFISRTKEYSDLNNLLYSVDNFESWKMNLVFRSDRIRYIFNENEEAIKKLNDILNDLDDEVVSRLFDLLKNLKQNDVLDASIIISICDKLIEYYEGKDNIEKLISLYLLKALEEMEFFVRMDTKTRDIPLECYNKIIKFRDRYNDLGPNNKRYIFMAYYNLLGPLSDLYPELRKKTLIYYKEARDLYLNYDHTDCEEEIEEEWSYITDVFLTQFTYIISLGDENIKKEYFMYVDELMDDIDELRMRLIKIARSYCDKSVSLDDTITDAYNLFLSYLGDGITFDGSDNNLNHFCNLFDIGAFVITLLGENNIKNEKTYPYISKIAYTLLDYISSVPYMRFTSYFDDISADLCKLLMPFAKDINQKDFLLNKLVLRRQPITYIHSIMVKEITLRIAKAILDNKIEIFKPLIDLGYDTKEKILAYLGKAGMYHDLGKCLTVGVINLQSRRLTTREYSYIKLHPSKSLELLQNDKDYLEYYDVMVGHHKYFNGLGGYPLDFDNLNSKYKIAIDLITISDSIDAATDIYGRNYTRGKTFKELLKELIDHSGTRYNDEIVSFIASNDSLIDELDKITGRDRLLVYYDAYKNIVKEK